MEAQYRQLESESSVTTLMTMQKGRKNIIVYALYAVLLFFLCLLLLITGLKFSQLSNDVNEIKALLAQTNSSAPSDSHAKARTVLVPETTPVRGACREGWVSHETRCYYLSKTKTTWSMAETWCQSSQGHLLVINNADELDFISSIAPLSSHYWIGLVERHTEGHWSWVDGSDYSSTEKFWDQGQPDDWDHRENGEDCGQIHASDERKRRLWNDADCDFDYHYICERGV